MDINLLLDKNPILWIVSLSPELRLNGSDSRCEGLVEILHPFNLQNEGPYGQACRTNATGDAEAMVICRQLNCDPVDARRVDPVQYVYFKFTCGSLFCALIRFGFSEAVDVYVAFNYSCTGSELRITDCEQIPFSEAMSECYGDEASSAIAVKCGGEPEVS